MLMDINSNPVHDHLSCQHYCKWHHLVSKKAHLNACAKALNGHFKLKRTSDQIANHMKTWRRKYNKLTNLGKLSATL
jgi:hypothetical protein